MVVFIIGRFIKECGMDFQPVKTTAKLVPSEPVLSIVEIVEGITVPQGCFGV